MSVKESGEEMADKFLVIDGSSLIHRAFFALPPLMTKQGVHTGAVYGFCNMLVKLLGDIKPKWLAVAFDKSRKTFRTEMFADYKGQRKPTPSELSEQFPLARRLLEAMNITVLETDGYEADDIIGTFAVHAPQNAEIIIVTGDKDELQLLDDRVKVYFTKRGISDIKAYDVAAFAADYEGLSPKQLIDLKGLMGDSSDNIPGVPGVGTKTALKLICEYGTVEKVLENIAQISGKSLKEKLENNKDAALLSKKLATIFTEVPVDLDLDKYELKAMSDEARPLMQELEFRNLHERFQTILGGSDGTFDLFGESIGQENANIEIALLETAEQGKEFFALLQQKQEKVAFTAVCGGELPKIHFTAVEIFPRRLRATENLRSMIRETELSVKDLIYPLFVVPGTGVKNEIESLPGNYHWSLDRLPEVLQEISELGIPAVILFGIPSYKNAVGSSAWDAEEPVQQACRLIKNTYPELVVVTDACLCEYTEHGHCGVLENGCTVNNDETLPLLAKIAVSHAQAGADVIAPSNMMDGYVKVMREALDEAGFSNVSLMAYSAKYASAYYGPFRAAADSTPSAGDRKGYQMDPGNSDEALREVALDIEEGADIVMVKPALAFMDIISRVKETFNRPLCVYNVSGEYAMVKAAAAKGWIDEQRIVMETMLGFKRAGAKMIITYHALDVAKWLLGK